MLLPQFLAKLNLFLWNLQVFFLHTKIDLRFIILYEHAVSTNILERVVSRMAARPTRFLMSGGRSIRPLLGFLGFKTYLLELVFVQMDARCMSVINRGSSKSRGMVFFVLLQTLSKMSDVVHGRSESSSTRHVTEQSGTYSLWFMHLCRTPLYLYKSVVGPL